MDKIFNKPFAINGARVAIPENGTENERVSFDKGFTQPYEVEAPSVDNPNGQGFNILRPEMNEILNQLSNACNILAENIDKWIKLTTENLNDIKQAGRYYQPLTAQATNERNYPENLAGYLIVLNNGINHWGVTQIYKTWNSERIYIRRTTSATEWSAWDSLVLTSEFNNKITSLQNTDTNLNNNKEDKTKYTMQELRNTDLNYITNNGFYQLRYNTNNSNIPFTVAGFLFVNNYGESTVRQIAIGVNNTGNFISARFLLNGTWSEWDKLTLESFTNSTYRKIADSYSKAQCDSTFLTIANANSTYRKIADSYSKAQCDSTFLTIANANSTYRKIADSYTKAEVYTKAETNNLMIAGGYSRNGYTANNIANATIPIPNKSIITGCCIMVTGIYNIDSNRAIDTDFIFKIDGREIGWINLHKNGQRDAGIGTFHLINQGFFNLSGELGKTIIPSIVQKGGSITKINFLVVWQ